MNRERKNILHLEVPHIDEIVWLSAKYFSDIWEFWLTSKFFKIQQISTNMTELRTFVFELWAEKKKLLLGNMDLVSALASFSLMLHV